MAVTSHGAPWIVDGGTARRGPCEGGGPPVATGGLVAKACDTSDAGEECLGTARSWLWDFWAVLSDIPSAFCVLLRGAGFGLDP